MKQPTNIFMDVPLDTSTTLQAGSLQCAFEQGVCNEDHNITYEMKGQALTNFRTNRIGLCVLLPIDSCQRQTAKVTSPGGKVNHITFPESINQHQPAKNMAGIEWHTRHNTHVRIALESDVFEMEYQRNWMDHSYKIYSRPLE